MWTPAGPAGHAQDPSQSCEVQMIDVMRKWHAPRADPVDICISVIKSRKRSGDLMKSISNPKCEARDNPVRGYTGHGRARLALWQGRAGQGRDTSPREGSERDE